MDKPKTVDDYLAAFPDHARRLLDELRALSRRCAPEAVESLKWGNPAYSLGGTIMFVFAGYRQHANFVFTPSTRAAFAGELTDYRTGKGSVQLPYGQPVPADLLGRMIGYRLREFREDRVLWM